MKIRILSLLFIVLSNLVSFGQSPRLVLPLGHTHKITVAVFSPDGKRIVTGSDDMTLKIWDVETGKLLADLKGHVSGISSIQFNLDGSRILSTASLDSSAILWDARSGKLVKIITPSRYYIDFARFSPDGKWLVTDHQRNILSSATGETVISLPGYGSLNDACFTPDSRSLVTLESDGVRVYDVLTGERKRSVKGNEPFRLSPDGKKALISSYDKKVVIWDPGSGDTLGVISDLREKPWDIQVGPDSRTAVIHELSGSSNKLFDLQTGKLVADLGFGYHNSSRIDFSADGSIVYFSNGTNPTKAWTTRDGQPVDFPKNASLLAVTGSKPVIVINATDERPSVRGGHSVSIETNENFSLAVFNPSGERFFGASGNNGGIWYTNTGTKLSDIKGHASPVRSVTAVPGLKQLLVSAGGMDNILLTGDGLLRSDESAINDSILHSFVSPDGKYLVTIRANNEASAWDPDKKISLWDLREHKLIEDDLWQKGMQQLTTVGERTHQFSADGSKFFISNNDWGSYIFETRTGKLLKEIPHERLWFATVDPTFTRFLAQHIPASFDQAPIIRIRDLQTGETINELQAEAGGWEKFRFISPDKYLAFDVQATRLYDVKKDKPVLQMPGGTYQLDKKSERILVKTFDTIGVWDLARARKVFVKANDIERSFIDACWSPDEQQIIYSQAGGSIVVYDLEGKTIRTIDVAAGDLQTSDDGKFLFALYDNQVTVISMETWNVLAVLRGHEHRVKQAYRIPGQERLLTIAEDNTARVWALPSGKMSYTYLLLGKELQMTYVPSGHYMANPEAARLLHYVTPELDVVSFDQLDIKFNRPDLVLHQAGKEHELLAGSYYKAWQKRLRKLGLDSNRVNGNVSLPAAEIANRESIAYEQKEDKLQIRITAKDSLADLARFHVWVNETPLFGEKGISLGKGRQSLDTTLTITLSEGMNHIESSVANINGAESYRKPLLVRHTTSTPSKAKTWFIGLAVDRYRDPKYNLQYSVKDIRDLATQFREKMGDELVVDTVFNEKLTKQRLAEIKKKLAAAGVNDRVIISYSGHGLLNKDFDYFLSTVNVNFDKPEEGGLAYEELEQVLDGIPPRQKLLLIDACHSGEVDKEDLVRIDSLSTDLVKGLKPVAYQNDNKLGLKNSFELMQTLFVDVAKSTGATVISAAAGTQFALERNDLENGVFTYSIRELLNSRPSIKVKELKTRVAERVKELTHGLQQPTFRNESRWVEWNVW